MQIVHVNTCWAHPSASFACDVNELWAKKNIYNKKDTDAFHFTSQRIIFWALATDKKLYKQVFHMGFAAVVLVLWLLFCFILLRMTQVKSNSILDTIIFVNELPCQP